MRSDPDNQHVTAAIENEETGFTTASDATTRQHLQGSLISMTPRQPTYIARLILVMQDCLAKLEAPNDDPFQLEQMAILIHESMSSSSRNYHSVQHVFDISKDLTDPLAILAALYHDVIYYNIDGGLSPSQAKILLRNYQGNSGGDGGGDGDGGRQCSNNLQLPVHDIHPDRVVLHTSTSSDGPEDVLLNMVEAIFGFTAGQGVSFQMGLNEFLSAVIAVRCLESTLTTPQLAQIACCIEATIPFRPRDVNTGQTPMERLFDRMVHVNQDFQLGLTEYEVVESVQRAALLSNQDISNFGTKDRNWFLDNTWSLLPETNESLRHQYLYTVKEFQQAVYKMNGFFNFLQPELVFSSFRDIPPPEHMAECVAECRRNLQVGKKYVGAKLLAISVLAAFCELTGGDAPMSLFMGDLPSRHHVSQRLEDSLPHIPVEKVDTGFCDRDVYSILYMGRRTETSFDIRQSPMAAYLYASLGDEGLQRVLTGPFGAALYPMTRDVALQLITILPRDAVTKIAQNMATVAVSRSARILQVIADLPDVVEGKTSSVREAKHRLNAPWYDRIV